MKTTRYPSWQNRHEAVLQYMLEYPAADYGEVARATGYSRWHISRITKSLEFRRRHRAHLDVASDLAALRMLTCAQKSTSMEAITDDYLNADNAISRVRLSNTLSRVATKQPAKCYP